MDLFLSDYRKAFDLIPHFTTAENLKVMSANKYFLLLVVDAFCGRYQRAYTLFRQILTQIVINPAKIPCRFALNHSAVR